MISCVWVVGACMDTENDKTLPVACLECSFKLSPEIKSLWLVGWRRCLNCSHVSGWETGEITSLHFPSGKGAAWLEWVESPWATAGSGFCCRMFGQCGDHTSSNVCPAAGSGPVGVGRSLVFWDPVGTAAGAGSGQSVLAGQGVLCTTAEETLLPWECGCWG